MSNFHADLNEDDIHIPYNWSYGTSGARTGASGFLTSDIGKLALQSDDNTLWMLTDTTPVWQEIGGKKTVILSLTGAMTTSSTTFFDIDTVLSGKTLRKVTLKLGTGNTGADFIVDFHKNGTTIFTDQDNRPRIVDGQTTGYTVAIDVNTASDGDRMTAIIDQKGSTVAGSDLGIKLEYY